MLHLSPTLSALSLAVMLFGSSGTTVDQTVLVKKGTLDPSDAKTPPGNHYKVYRFWMHSGYTYRIQVTSTEFLPHLQLQTANGKTVFVVRDDGNPPLHDKVYLRPPYKGWHRYRVKVMSSMPRQYGTFVLRIMRN